MGTNQSSPNSGARRDMEHEDAGGEVAVKSPVANPKDAKAAPPRRPSPVKEVAAKDDGKKDVSATKSSRPSSKSESGNVGNMLRGAYRQTVEEAIPDDLMDLLNRLE